MGCASSRRAVTRRRVRRRARDPVDATTSGRRVVVVRADCLPTERARARDGWIARARGRAGGGTAMRVGATRVGVTRARTMRGMTRGATTRARGVTPLVGAAACAAGAGAAWLARAVMTRERVVSAVRVLGRDGRSDVVAKALDACAEALEGGYDAVAWLRNAHASTILSSLLRRDVEVAYQREVVMMPDGGVVALDWPLGVDGDGARGEGGDADAGGGGEDAGEIERRGPPYVKRVFDQSVLVKRRLREHHATTPADAPVLMLMSGIAGGSHDKYLKHFLKRARANGFRCVAFNCRGTSESPLTTPQFYSASYTGDVRHVVDLLHERFPDAPLFAIGWSLGANILTNFLGEEGENAKLDGAAALCNPFDLNKCDTALESGFFGKIYSRAMASNMRKLFAPHENLFAGLPKYKPELVKRAKTVRDFDEAITRVTFGFPSVDAYYEYSGSKNKIGDVRVPLLAVQALDDPIAVAESIPRDIIEKNENVVLIETETGGHLAWEAGPEAPFGAPWPDAVVMQFFQSLVETKRERKNSPATDSIEKSAAPAR